MHFHPTYWVFTLVLRPRVHCPRQVARHHSRGVTALRSHPHGEPQLWTLQPSLPCPARRCGGVMALRVRHTVGLLGPFSSSFSLSVCAALCLAPRSSVSHVLWIICNDLWRSACVYRAPRLRFLTSRVVSFHLWALFTWFCHIGIDCIAQPCVGNALSFPGLYFNWGWLLFPSSASLCLLNGEFDPCTFKVLISM